MVEAVRREGLAQVEEAAKDGVAVADVVGAETPAEVGGVEGMAKGQDAPD